MIKSICTFPSTYQKSLLGLIWASSLQNSNKLFIAFPGLRGMTNRKPSGQEVRTGTNIGIQTKSTKSPNSDGGSSKNDSGQQVI